MTKKKVFFHYEAKGYETFTKSLLLKENHSSVAEVIQRFISSFHLENPDILLDRVELTDDAGNVFLPTDDLFSLVSNKDDCFVVCKKRPVAANIVTSNSSDEKSPQIECSGRSKALRDMSDDDCVTNVDSPKGNIKGNKLRKKDATASSSPSDLSRDDYQKQISRIDDMMLLNSYRKVKELCLSIIEDYPGDPVLSSYLCFVMLKCKNYADVIKYAEHTLDCFSVARDNVINGTEEVTTFVLSILKVLFSLVTSLLEQEDISDVDEAMERLMQGIQFMHYTSHSSSGACKSLSDVPSSIFKTSYISSQDVQALVLNAPSIFEPMPSLPSNTTADIVTKHKGLVHVELDFKAALTKCLVAKNRNEEAGTILNALIKHPLSGSHLLSLLAYSQIAASYDKFTEAVQGALKAIVLDSSDSRAKGLIAKLLSTEGGLQELYNQVPPSSQAVTAYAFLATVVKDLSYLDTAETLLRQVIKMDSKKDATHFLGLVHILEGKLDLRGALNTILLAIKSQQRRPDYDDSRNLEFFPGVTVFSWCDKWNSLFSEAMSFCNSAQDQDTTDKSGKKKKKPKRFTMNVNMDMKSYFVHFIRNNIGEKSKTSEDSTMKQSEGDYAIVRCISDYHTADIELLDELESVTKASKEYGNNLLDILALSFTAVKLLFLLGRLGDLPLLIQHIECARRASPKPLHETNIRNEHAYYLCVVQIMSFYTSPADEVIRHQAPGFDCKQFSPFSNPDIFNSIKKNRGKELASPIYICGDSHVLSSAFSVIDSASQPRILIPKLVTGVKQWHLRKDSMFYTKETFKRNLASIPDGSEVIFLIGEIDCREGILVAVERGKYKNVKEGMEATISIFQQVVKDAIQRKRLKVYIHPIIPVLDVTRQVVLMFNSLYRAAMEKVKGCYWLEMENNFLRDEGNYTLKDELRLDGTHVSPAYVFYLEQSINQCSRSK